MDKLRRSAAGGRNKKAQPPIFSHEFVIQNHGDIMSCVIMVFVVGIMFPLTSAVSGVFVLPQYNETHKVTIETVEYDLNGYRAGVADIATIAFYSVGWIVVHAIIQEYIIDKLQRKTHLSKTSAFKFTESGHAIIFAFYTLVHGASILQEVFSGNYDVKRVWIGYPEEHRWMSASYKMFFILQIGYWIHQFPEFYFQKLKKDEMKQKTYVSVVHIFFTAIAYFFNFNRIALVLILLESVSQLVYHVARFAHYLDKKQFAKSTFKVWNAIFLAVRFSSVLLSVMTFFYGLRQSETPYIDPSTGNYNTSFTRLNFLLSVVTVQVLLIWSFVSFHLGRFRETGKKDKKKSASATPLQPKKKRNEDSKSSDVDASHDSKSSKKKN